MHFVVGQQLYTCLASNYGCQNHWQATDQNTQLVRPSSAIQDAEVCQIL